jgi:hypothetical protein
MKIARFHFGNRVSNVAGLICAVAYPFLLAPLRIWDTCLSAVLLLGMLAFASTCALQINEKAWIIVGAACGLAGLVNPSLLPTLFLIWAWSVWQSKKIPWPGLLAFMLVFAAWPMRNLVVMHVSVPLRSNFGYELWMGNHPGGDGDFVESMNPMTNPNERERFVSEGEIAFMREKDAYAKTYIRSHPAEFAKLTLHRAGRFWTGTANGGPALTAPLVILALPGLAFMRKRKRILLLFAVPLCIFPLPYYITHPDVRFQYVIDPVLAILAAVGLDAFLTNWPTTRRLTPTASRGVGDR